MGLLQASVAHSYVIQPLDHVDLEKYTQDTKITPKGV